MKNRTVVWMLVFLFAVVVMVALLFAPLRAAFLANPLFNGMIIGVLAVGIGVVFQQVLSLQHERVWLSGRQAGIAAFDGREPRMLAPSCTRCSRRAPQL